MKRPLALWAVAFVLGEGLFLLGEGQGVKNVFVGGTCNCYDYRLPFCGKL